MRISGQKQEILSGLQSVIGVVSAKNTLPILANILIEAEKDRAQLTTTDLDIGMTLSIPATIEEPGAITTPAKRLIEIVKELPDKKMEIYTKKNNMVVVESEGIVFKVMGVPKEEFPQLPAFTEKDHLTIDQARLKKMLNMTCFAMSHDETRYVLNGTCIMVTKDILRTVATDGRRLSIAEQQNDTGFAHERTAIIPTKTIHELIRALREEGSVAITFSKNQARFQIDNLIIISRLIEGEFPNYEQAIPKEAKNKLRANLQQLTAAVKRANLLTTPESQAIRLNAQKNKLTISKNTPEIGELKEELDVDYKGEDILIGFNPAYLLDVFKVIQKEEVELEMSGPEKPGVIRIDKEYIYIVLPMQIV